MAASTDYTRFIMAIADTHAGIPGYTVTITDPYETLTEDYLRSRINTCFGQITPHLTVTTSTSTTDGTPKWHIFVPESVIAPEACYAHSPIDDFCQSLCGVIPMSQMAYSGGRAAPATTAAATTDPIPAYTLTESGHRRSTRIAAKYAPPLEATTGGRSAHSVDVSPHASVPTKTNNQCSFTTQKGTRCKRKCVPDSTVCHQHEYDLAVQEHKAKKASVPKPTTNDTLHPEPAHIPDDLVTAILSDLETATSELPLEKNLTEEMVTEFLASMETVLTINPTITHPTVLEKSHPTHTHIRTPHTLTQRIHDNYIGWRRTKTIKESDAVKALVTDIQEMARLLQQFL